MKNNNIPEYLLCPTPELARQVLEKIERESDLRWIATELKPTGYLVDINLDFYPVIIKTIEQLSWFSDDHITKFTKAEDFLGLEKKIIETQYDLHGSGGVRSFKGQQEVYVKKSLKLNNNSMTNKTWETLSAGDILIDNNGYEREVFGTLGRLISISNCNKDVFCGSFTKEQLIEMGFKIKGASEEKLSIGDAIEWINNLTGIDKQIKNQAIEMLKKLK